MKLLRIITLVMGLALVVSIVCSSQKIDRKDFFKDIVGFDENFFRKQYDFKRDGSNLFGVLSKFKWGGHSAWANRKPGKGVGLHRRKSIFDGDFSVPTISNLKKQSLSGKPGSFRLLLHDPGNPQKTDIRALQADPANSGAGFQLASTFFGPLEGGMYKWQSRLTDMTKHPVQGEEASISAAPAAIYRKYFMALDPKHKQFRVNKFYLLYALHGKLPMKFKPKGGPYVDARNYQFNLGDKDRVAVGVHYNILATSGYGGNGPKGTQQRLGIMRNAQRITQIFTSAYDTRSLRGDRSAGYGLKLTKNVQDAARMLLEGAYEGTIRAAASKGIKKLYLTLVGGGSFRNDIRWVGKAIWKMRDVIKNSGVDVVLIYRPDKARPQDIIQIRTVETDLHFLKNMCLMADYINGTNNCEQSIEGLMRQYIAPSYQGKKPSSYQVNQLQQLLDKKEQRRVVPAPLGRCSFKSLSSIDTGLRPPCFVEPTPLTQQLSRPPFVRLDKDAELARALAASCESFEREQAHRKRPSAAVPMSTEDIEVDIESLGLDD